jgi:tight adherence protein B
MPADGRLLFAALLSLLGLAALALAGMAAVDLAQRLRLHVRAQAIAAAGAGPRHASARPRPNLFLGREEGPLLLWLYARHPALRRLERQWTAADLGRRELGAAAAVGLLLAAAAHWLGLGPLLLPLAAVGGWILAVRIWWGRARAQRRARFLAAMPEALGLIVRGLRSGSPIVECLAEVGREVQGPLGAAFRRACEQVRLGQPLERALRAETEGLDIRPMAFLLVTLSIQRETGGNLAETLGKLEAMLRRREQMELRVRALSSEARASAWIIAALPVVLGLLMWAMAPDYLLPLFTTGGGRVLLGLSVASLLVGGWIMAQLVRFDL